MPPMMDPPIRRWITTQPPNKPTEHKAPESLPTPAAFPHVTQRKWSVKQGLGNIIDLTTDSSDAESLGTSDGEPPSANVPGDLRNTPVNPASPAPPLSERISSEPSIHGFSMGSTIFGPNLNLIKEPHDKPRSLIRYTVDFEVGLANISAHGFVDQIHMKSRW